MIGRTPSHIQAVRPLKDGVIADFDVTEKMLRYFIQRVHKRRLLAKPRVVVCVPSRHHRRRAARGRGGHDRGRRATRLHHRGADGRRDRRRPSDPRADRQHDRRHRWRHHRGRRDLARRHRHVDLAADRRRRARRGDHQLREEGVLARCSASAPPRRSSSRSPRCTRCRRSSIAEIPGRDLVSGLPKTIQITDGEIRQAIEEPVTAIIDSIKATLDRTPPELAGDIMHRGIVLTGGGALLRGLDKRLRHETGHAGPHRRQPALLGRDRLGQVPRGVRGPPAGPGEPVPTVGPPWPSRPGPEARGCSSSRSSRSRCSRSPSTTARATPGRSRRSATRRSRSSARSRRRSRRSRQPDRELLLDARASAVDPGGQRATCVTQVADLQAQIAIVASNEDRIKELENLLQIQASLGKNVQTTGALVIANGVSNFEWTSRSTRARATA